MKIHQYLWAAFVILPVVGVTTGVVQQTVRPTAVAHDLAGRSDCLMCHAQDAMPGVIEVTDTHAERGNETCLWCHAADSPLLTIDPAPIPHSVVGRDDCLVCHAVGAMEPVTNTPDNHTGRENNHCRMCHKEGL